MNIVILFAILSIVNVIGSTARSLITINGSKFSAGLINAAYFSFYNIMIIYTVADFSLAQKCIITALCNFIGVYSVKWVEELMRKDKLWKIETTITKADQEAVCDMLNRAKIPYNYIEGIGKYTIFNVFCATQDQSTAVKEILKAYNAKYFVSESKTL